MLLDPERSQRCGIVQSSAVPGGRTGGGGVRVSVNSVNITFST